MTDADHGEKTNEGKEEIIGMKKVLFITNIPSPYRVEFFNQLGQENGIELTVFFTECPDGDNYRNDQWFGRDFYGFKAVFCTNHKMILNKFDLCPEILGWVKKDFDFIIFGGYSDPPYMIAMEYLKLHHRPYILEVDGGLTKQDNKIMRFIKRHFIGGAAYWFSSGKMTDRYLLHYGAKKEKIVPYPFSSLTRTDMEDAAQKVANRQACRQIVGYEGKKNIVYVGRMTYDKGTDLLLEAAARLPKDIRFYLIGDEPAETYVKFCEEHGLDNVTFLPFKSKKELLDYYAGADFCVFPTRHDVWGLVVNEAMACGLGVISTDQCVAGMELIEEGKNGSIVPIDDPDALANAIAAALPHSEQMGRASLEKIRAYTTENMVRAHVEFFAQQERL